MRGLTIGGYMITTDGITVWINGAAGCVGRFAKETCFVCELHFRGEPEHWVAWELYCDLVAVELGVVLPDSFKPGWC